MAEPHTSWYVKYRTGFFIAKRAEGISQETVRAYSHTFGYFGEWLQTDQSPPTDRLPTPHGVEVVLFLVARRPGRT